MFVTFYFKNRQWAYRQDEYEPTEPAVKTAIRETGVPHDDNEAAEKLSRALQRSLWPTEVEEIYRVTTGNTFIYVRENELNEAVKIALESEDVPTSQLEEKTYQLISSGSLTDPVAYITLMWKETPEKILWETVDKPNAK